MNLACAWPVGSLTIWLASATTSRSPLRARRETPGSPMQSRRRRGQRRRDHRGPGTRDGHVPAISKTRLVSIQPPRGETQAFEFLRNFADANGCLECGLRLGPRPSTKRFLANRALCGNSGGGRHSRRITLPCYHRRVARRRRRAHKSEGLYEGVSRGAPSDRRDDSGSGPVGGSSDSGHSTQTRRQARSDCTRAARTRRQARFDGRMERAGSRNRPSTPPARSRG